MKTYLLIFFFFTVRLLIPAHGNFPGSTFNDSATFFTGDTLKISVSWKSQRTIIGNTDNPSGLLGVYNKTLPFGITVSDTRNAIAFLDFPQCDSSDFTSVSVKGFNLLNTSSQLYKTPQQFWKDFNRPWLESLVQRKAAIYVLSDANNDLLKYSFTLTSDSCTVHYGYSETNHQLIRTGFGKEIEFMDSVVRTGNYSWDQQLGVYTAN